MTALQKCPLQRRQDYLQDTLLRALFNSTKSSLSLLMNEFYTSLFYETAISPGKCFPMSPSRIAASFFLWLVHLQYLGS